MKKRVSVGEMLREKLTELGCDCLANPEQECSCPMDDLGYGDGCLHEDDCLAAKAVPCKGVKLSFCREECSYFRGSCDGIEQEPDASIAAPLEIE